MRMCEFFFNKKRSKKISLESKTKRQEVKMQLEKGEVTPEVNILVEMIKSAIEIKRWHSG